MSYETFSYPVAVEKDGKSFVLTARDIPHFIWQVDDEKSLRKEAIVALTETLSYYFKEGAFIPPASTAQKGEIIIDLPLSFVAKIILHNAMVRKSIRPADLARMLQVPTSEVARITNPHYKTKIDTLAEAVTKCGGRLQLVA